MTQEEFYKVLGWLMSSDRNWIEKCFVGNSRLAEHFRERHDKYSSVYGNVHATLMTIYSFDSENSRLFFEYVKSQINK